VFLNVVIGADGRPGGRDATALASALAAPGASVSQVSIRGQQPAAGLRDVALRRGADLLVIGSCHRGSFGRLLLGDDSRAVLARAPCPVAIAPRGYAPPDRLVRIGVGYDGSPEAELAMSCAQGIARANGVRAGALCVIPPEKVPYGEPIAQHWPEAARELLAAGQERPDRLANVDGDITYGQPGEELARFASELDLLIVGSRAMGPLDRLLEGSTSAYLARHAQCPLIVIPSAAPGDQRKRRRSG